MKTIKIKANGTTYLVKAKDSSEAMQKLVESGEVKFVNKQCSPNDSSIKDAYVDIDHIADYLWTWEDKGENPARELFLEAYHESTATNEKDARTDAYAKSKTAYDNAYLKLKSVISKRLENGYKLGLSVLEQLKNK